MHSTRGTGCWWSTTCWPPGGTAAATIGLVEAAGGTVAGTCVLVELVDLGGRALLAAAAPGATFAALLTY